MNGITESQDRARIGQRLQMPAHSGLRELKCGTELADREVTSVEQREDARPRLVSERVQSMDNRRSRQRIHRFEYEDM